MNNSYDINTKLILLVILLLSCTSQQDPNDRDIKLQEYKVLTTEFDELSKSFIKEPFLFKDEDNDKLKKVVEKLKVLRKELYPNFCEKP